MSDFGRGRYGRGPSYGVKKPVEVGNVEVTELSRRGDGVAKVEGFVIFVQGAKAGEKVRVKVDGVGPRFVTASIVAQTSNRFDVGDQAAEPAQVTSREPAEFRVPH